MPIFDHRCKSCGFTWEGFVNNSAPNPPCPKCNGDTKHVLLTPLHFERDYRMRSVAEIKKRVSGDIRKLNDRLLIASNKIAIELQKHEIAKTPQGRIVVALFKKAVNTFRGIQMLKSDRLLEEAFVLLRVLLESHINLIYFLKSKDATELTRRWSHAAILEKLKYLREVSFFEGTPLEKTGAVLPSRRRRPACQGSLYGCIALFHAALFPAFIRDGAGTAHRRGCQDRGMSQ